MGGLFSSSYAENQLNDMINVAINIANTATQNCLVSGFNNQDITIQNWNGSVIIEHLDFSQIVALNSTCSTNAAFSSQIQTQIESELQQQASALVGALSLGSSDAENIINAVISLSQQITNTFLQNCTTASGNNFKVTLNSGTGSIYIGYINDKQYIKSVQNCIQQVASTSDAASLIKQTIAQSATAQTEGIIDALTKLLLPLALVLIVVVVIVLGLSVAKPGMFGSAGSSGGGSSSTSDKMTINITPTGGAPIVVPSSSK